MQRIGCHSAFKHYQMFHSGSYCDEGYGSIFNTTYNVVCNGSHSRGFLGGVGLGLGASLGNLFSGFIGNLFGGFGCFGGNMFGGLGNLFGGFGGFGGFGNYGNFWGNGYSNFWGGGSNGNTTRTGDTPSTTTTGTTTSATTTGATQATRSSDSSTESGTVVEAKDGDADPLADLLKRATDLLKSDAPDMSKLQDLQNEIDGYEIKDEICENANKSTIDSIKSIIGEIGKKVNQNPVSHVDLSNREAQPAGKSDNDANLPIVSPSLENDRQVGNGGNVQTEQQAPSVSTPAENPSEAANVAKIQAASDMNGLLGILPNGGYSALTPEGQAAFDKKFGDLLEKIKDESKLKNLLNNSKLPAKFRKDVKKAMQLRDFASGESVESVKRVHDSGKPSDIKRRPSEKNVTMSNDGTHPETITMTANGKPITYTYVKQSDDGEFIYESSIDHDGKHQEYVLLYNEKDKQYELHQYSYHYGWDEADV